MEPAWEIESARWPRETLAAVAEFAGGAELAWLDGQVSGAAARGGPQCSLVCVEPAAVLEQFDGGVARLVVDGRTAARGASAWGVWRRALAELPRWPAVPWSVAPGWVGYVGFEAARQLERLPANHRLDLGLPLARLALFERGVILDHAERRAYVVAARGLSAALGSHTDRASTGADDLRQRWDAAADARSGPVAIPGGQTRWDISRADYERMVERGLDYIAAGDIYQVNLAQRLRIDGLGSPFATFAAVRRTNPAPYAALLRWGECAVASFSPELFVRLRGADVLTRPIKGTRPRTGDPQQDARLRHELLASAKEAAELAMIVDLHRNDLGRVCEYGSVCVRDPRCVEAHPTVFHTVADVVGRLQPGRDALDLLAMCFPAGSISGVPKIRALQIIDELEPAARGVYTGAIGFVGLDGQMTMNVAIRTLQICGPAATLYVGGGIVADSEPAAEYEETLAKARGIMRGLVGAPGAQRVARVVNAGGA